MSLSWMTIISSSEHSKNFTVYSGMERPPYSPDLSLSDYHMLGPVKEELGGHRLDNDTAVETLACK